MLLPGFEPSTSVSNTDILANRKICSHMEELFSIYIFRFWKMADTFTGLKLQGELGRFGRTEISDVEGYVELPDGKVLSGCEWGNLLLWDGGLIKVEVTRRHGKTCHLGKVMQILLDEGELITVGEDGFIRVRCLSFLAYVTEVFYRYQCDHCLKCFRFARVRLTVNIIVVILCS